MDNHSSAKAGAAVQVRLSGPLFTALEDHHLDRDAGAKRTADDVGGGLSVQQPVQHAEDGRAGAVAVGDVRFIARPAVLRRQGPNPMTRVLTCSSAHPILPLTKRHARTAL